MFKKNLSLMLVTFLMQMICIAPVSAVVPADKETERVSKLKEHISAIHLKKKRAIITLRDETKLKGRIGEVKEFSFSISDERTDTTSEVRFESVAQVKTKGNALATSTKILIGAGIAAVVVLVLIIKPLGKSPFPKCNADQSNAPCDR